MITVTYDPGHCRLTLRGHAGDGEYGNNAVCAAASILACTLADGLEALVKKGKLSHCTVVLEPGYGRLHCRESTPAARRLFAHTARGFRLLAHTCPEQVKMNAEYFHL